MTYQLQMCGVLQMLMALHHILQQLPPWSHTGHPSLFRKSVKEETIKKHIRQISISRKSFGVE